MKILNKKKGKALLHTAVIVLLLILFIAVLILPKFIAPELAEIYSGRIFGIIAMPANLITECVQISVTETCVIVGAPLAFILAIVFLVILIKKLMTKGAKEYLYKVTRVVLIAGIILGAIYGLMHGVNYRRYPARQLLKLYGGDYSYEDYENTLNWAYLGMLSARAELGEDYSGVAHMNNSFENNVSYANMLINDVLGRYDIKMSNTIIRAKPVALSHYWSMVGVTGMYTPFLGEANINTDYMDITEFPITICHEILHAKGFARETDCNLLAAVCCIRSSRPDFRYAGYYAIFWSLYPIVSDYAASENRTLYPYSTDPAIADVYADIMAGSRYWDGIEEETAAILDIFGIDLMELGEDANNAFLEANGQEGGTDTYEVPYSVYVDFYKRYVEDTDA